MSKYRIEPHGEPWYQLREQCRLLVLLLEQSPLQLVDLGKRLETTIGAALRAVESQGISSLRLAAAAKALNLKTPKSSLEAFLSSDR